MDTEGTIIQIISSSDIKSTGLLNWSADDRWLTFTTLSPDYSTAPFAVDLKTENIRNLHPHPSVRYTKGLMRPSPVENVILFAGLVEKPKLSAELWLLSLDENQAPIPIEFDMPPECGWFTDIEWSPDGKTFLVQPAAISYEHECWPRIYTYDLSNKSWSDILHAPDETRKFANLYFLAYSPDGKWLGWSSSASQNALILSTNTWEVITTIDFRGIGGFPGSPWVQNSAGQSILSIVESSYSADYSDKHLIYGIDLNVTTERTLIVEIAPESEWLPEGLTSYPLWWQP